MAVLAAALVPLSAAQGGAFSGNNGPLAYTCGANVCQINPDGTGRTTLITGGTDPTWSSDATEIAYVGAADLFVANADGSGTPQQLGAGATAVQPTFSPDGTRVAFSKAGDLAVINSDGSGFEQPLTSGAANDVEPAYSPDGSKVAYSSNNDIWVVNVSNGTRTQLTTAGADHSPTWSPSGLTIVYSSSGHLNAISSSGGAPTPLNRDGTDPAYSPDGTSIAFIDTSGHLVQMAASVNGAVTPIDATGTFSQPDWQSTSPPPLSGSGPPKNLSYPTINLSTGDTSPVVGHFLTSSIGTWDGAFPITYKYQWKRCDAADPVNGPCVAIPNATSSFYTPVNADVGFRLRVAVTATNSLGSASQNSEVSEKVVALAPKLRSTPQIVGNNVVDQTLTLTAGVWDGSTPIVFTYSWRHCNPVGDLETCVQIPGATAATYTLKTSDIGFAIRVYITGTNPAGTDLAITNHTFPIVDKQHFAPSATTRPAVVGTTLPGRQLTANVGVYGGDAPVATAFTWQRCDATGESCHVISGAKKIVYFPTFSDVGYTIRLVVTATNAYGKVTVRSDPTETVAATPPHRKGRHIVGTAKGEYLAGGPNDDVVIGNGGNDTIPGGAGDDRLQGGRGNDVITGGAGADILLGGPGSDTINAADGERDVVDCGPGADRAIVDSFDKVTSCEVVDTPSTPAARRR